MLKEAKYYTPSIEEFHVGFEYLYAKNINYDEISLGKVKIKDIISTSFIKRIFSRGDWIGYEGEDYLEEFCNSGLVKVKYLDREDIESLGFEDFLDNEFRFFKNHLEYCITIKESLEVGVIDNSVIGESYQTLFKGTIKNKSELKKLLKQLNIN